MRKRGLLAVVAVLTGGLTAGGAALAAAPVLPNSPAAFAGSANLNLGSLMMSGFGQDQTSRNAAGVSIDLAQGRNWDTNRDLFSAPVSLNSTFLSATQTRTAAGFSVAPGLSLNLSHVAFGLGGSQTFPQALAVRLDPSLRSSGTTVANLNWNVTSWSELAITASRSSGNSSLLGVAPDTLRLAAPTDSSALGISARVGFSEGWVTTLAYSEGVTQLDLSQIGSANAVRSDAYGIGVAKTGLFGNDAFGIALSRPLQQLYPGSTSTTTPNFGFNMSQARESDVELGYVTSFLDGTLALQANAAYQVNAAGARGQNALAGVARAKLNF